MNPQNASLGTILQGGSIGIPLQGSSPQLQASRSSGLQVQPAYQPTLNQSGSGGIPVNYYQPSGTPIGSTQSQYYNQGAAQINRATGQNVTPGTAGFGMNLGGYQQGINQEYGAAIGGASNAIAQNEANLGINQGLLNQYVGAQEDLTRGQTANQVNTYNTQKQGVVNQQQLSLQELADQIRGQNQGLQAQLGAVGAGSSSASLMGQYALQKEHNINAANVDQQAGANVANINAQIQQTQDYGDRFVNTLEAYKNQQMQQILQNYNTLQNQLVTQIGQAQGEQKARLAQFGASLSNAAGAALTALDQQVAAAAGNFAAQQKAALANNPGQFQALPTKEAPAAIQSPSVSPFSIQGSSNGGGESFAGGSLSTLLQQQKQNS